MSLIDKFLDCFAEIDFSVCNNKNKNQPEKLKVK